MQITVTERQSYKEEKYLHIYLEEKVNGHGTSYNKRTLLFTHFFTTGWNSEDKVRKIASKQYDKCIQAIFNKRIADDFINDYDSVVRECAGIRLQYPKVYFKREQS